MYWICFGTIVTFLFLAWFIKFLVEVGWYNTTFNEEFFDYIIDLFTNRNIFGYIISVFVLVTMIPFMCFLILINVIDFLYYILQSIINLGMKNK